MLGVVLWSSEARESAVIWCEDHGPVAYLKGRAQLWPVETPVTDRKALAEPLRWPLAGDLVALDLGGSPRVRLARRVRLLERHWRSQLPADLLRMAPQDLAMGADTAQDLEADGLFPTGSAEVSCPGPSTPNAPRNIFGPFGPPPPGQGMMRPPQPAPGPGDQPVMLRLVAQNPVCDEPARPRRRARPIDS